MAQGYYISDVLQEVVNAVSTELGYKVHFQFGHPLEIIENLKILTTATQNDDKKYPLVALLTDFDEKRGVESNSPFDYQSDLNILIITVTDKEYLAAERIEKSFKLILHPIYDSLLNQIKLNSKIHIDYSENNTHTKIDHLYWGKSPIYEQKPNVFSDYIDCVELKNFNLKIKKLNLCQ